jgi:translation initiation factor 2 beta subunit (eIF-2beta)/eIF-5
MTTVIIKPTFDKMVEEAYMFLTDNSKQREKLIIPDIKTNIETTRLHFININNILKIIRRTPDHFSSWLSAEIPDKTINWLSSDKDEGLIIHGKFRKDTEIAKLVLKYVNMFVVCTSCKSTNTDMTKTQFICNDCMMTKFV